TSPSAARVVQFEHLTTFGAATLPQAGEVVAAIRTQIDRMLRDGQTLQLMSNPRGRLEGFERVFAMLRAVLSHIGKITSDRRIRTLMALLSANHAAARGAAWVDADLHRPGSYFTFEHWHRVLFGWGERLGVGRAGG